MRANIGKILLSTAVIVPFVCAAGPVHAQASAAAPTSAPPPASPAPAPAATDTGIADIVVTANKREERLNNVGLTITALPAQVLAERKITDLASIASVVPGLNFAESASNTPILTLRGVGFDSATLGSYPAVSLYTDQIPLPFAVLGSHASYDLERIEVLKGPQGTLFGENSTGGAINFIAAKPTSSLEEGGDITYGRFNDVQGNAYVSGPLSDTLSARIAGTFENRDAWQISDSRPYDRNGKLSYGAARLILDWHPSDGIRFSLNVNGWIDKSQPEAPQFIALVPQTLTPSAAEESAPFSRRSPRSADFSTGEFAPRGDRKFYQIGLRSDIDVTDKITFTALTSYDHFTQKQTEDFDGLPIAINNNHEDGRIESFNQEVRFASTPNMPFRWVVGGNYEKSTTFDNQLAQITDQAGAQDPYTGFDNAFTFVHQKIRNLAGFANGEYDLTSKLTVKGGVRYTDSRNSAALCTGDGGSGRLTGVFSFLEYILGLPPIATPPGSCLAFNLQGVPDTSPTQLQLNEHNVSWRGGLDYRLSAGSLLYVDISRGYKAGSFPLFAAPSVKQYFPVTQESVTAYEGGIKTDLFDRHVHVNAAAFYYDYKNKQVLGKTFIDNIFYYQNTLINIPKSRVLGLESDITIRPLVGLTLSGSGTYLDTKVQRYVGFNSIGQGPLDLSGNRLPFAPKFAYNLDVEYRHRLPSGGAPFLAASLSGQSSTDATIGGSNITIPNTPGDRVAPGVAHPLKIDAYALLDLRAGYEAPGGAWRVMIYGKNVLNKYYWTNAISSEAIVRYAGTPATYGVTVGFRFR